MATFNNNNNANPAGAGQNQPALQQPPQLPTQKTIQPPANLPFLSTNPLLDTTAPNPLLANKLNSSTLSKALTKPPPLSAVLQLPKNALATNPTLNTSQSSLSASLVNGNKSMTPSPNILQQQISSSSLSASPLPTTNSSNQIAQNNSNLSSTSSLNNSLNNSFNQSQQKLQPQTSLLAQQEQILSNSLPATAGTQLLSNKTQFPSSVSQPNNFSAPVTNTPFQFSSSQPSSLAQSLDQSKSQTLFNQPVSQIQQATPNWFQQTQTQNPPANLNNSVNNVLSASSSTLSSQPAPFLNNPTNSFNQMHSTTTNSNTLNQFANANLTNLNRPTPPVGPPLNSQFSGPPMPMAPPISSPPMGPPTGLLNRPSTGPPLNAPPIASAPPTGPPTGPPAGPPTNGHLTGARLPAPNYLNQHQQFQQGPPISNGPPLSAGPPLTSPMQNQNYQQQSQQTNLYSSAPPIQPHINQGPPLGPSSIGSPLGPPPTTAQQGPPTGPPTMASLIQQNRTQANTQQPQQQQQLVNQMNNMNISASSRSQPQALDLLREKKLIQPYSDEFDEPVRPVFPHEFYTNVNCHAE
jgi:hypothetical protein